MKPSISALLDPDLWLGYTAQSIATAKLVTVDQDTDHNGIRPRYHVTVATKGGELVTQLTSVTRKEVEAELLRWYPYYSM